MVACPFAPSNAPVPPMIAGVGGCMVDMSSWKAYSSVPASNRTVRSCAPAQVGIEGFPFTALAAVVLGKAAARAGEPTAADQIEQAPTVAEREDSWLIRAYVLLAQAEACIAAAISRAPAACSPRRAAS
jgi:hypothetical protein